VFQGARETSGSMGGSYSVITKLESGGGGGGGISIKKRNGGDPGKRSSSSFSFMLRYNAPDGTIEAQRFN